MVFKKVIITILLFCKFYMHRYLFKCIWRYHILYF